MINTENLIKLLYENLGVTEYSGVPCSNLKYLINYVESNGIYEEAPNEGEAVAYAAGAYFAGTKVAVLMQNSGLANAMNVITSLTCIYKIPQIYLIGYRGMHGAGTDEPQHEVMGRVTEAWLTDCGIIPIVVSKFDNENDLIKEVIGFNRTHSVALLFDKNDLSKVNAPTIEQNTRSPQSPSRNEVLDTIVENTSDDTALIATTGFTGRDLYDHHHSDRNFYMVGSMGCAVTIGLGVALNSKKKVIVIDGDGAVLMRPQGGIMYSIHHPDNMLHIIIDNGLYESTGKQFLPGLTTYDLSNLEVGIHGFGEVITIYDTFSLARMIRHFEEGDRSPRVIIVKVNSYKNDNNLGRPKETCTQLAKQFMEFIKK